MTRRSRSSNCNPYMIGTRLSEKQASGIIHHFVLNKSTRETAKNLNLTPKTVAQWNKLLVQRIHAMDIETDCCMLPINNCVWVPQESGEENKQEYIISRDVVESWIRERLSKHRFVKSDISGAQNYESRRKIYLQVLSFWIIFQQQAPHQSAKYLFERAENQASRILKDAILSSGPLNSDNNEEDMKKSGGIFWEMTFKLVVTCNHPKKWPITIQMLTGNRDVFGQDHKFAKISDGRIIRIDPKELAMGVFRLREVHPDDLV